jgi:hypothetical protein
LKSLLALQTIMTRVPLAAAQHFVRLFAALIGRLGSSNPSASDLTAISLSAVRRVRRLHSMSPLVHCMNRVSAFTSSCHLSAIHNAAANMLPGLLPALAST